MKNEEQIKEKIRQFYYLLKADEPFHELEKDEKASFKYAIIMLCWVLVEPDYIDGIKSIDIGENVKINPHDYI